MSLWGCAGAAGTRQYSTTPAAPPNMHSGDLQECLRCDGKAAHSTTQAPPTIHTVRDVEETPKHRAVAE